MCYIFKKCVFCIMTFVLFSINIFSQIWVSNKKETSTFVTFISWNQKLFKFFFFVWISVFVFVRLCDIRSSPSVVLFSLLRFLFSCLCCFFLFPFIYFSFLQKFAKQLTKEIVKTLQKTNEKILTFPLHFCLGRLFTYKEYLKAWVLYCVNNAQSQLSICL